MADFCNNCIVEIFGNAPESASTKPDIDVYEIFKELPTNHYMPVICEGCTMTAIKRTEDNELKLSYMDYEKDKKELVEWKDYPKLK